MWLSSSTLLGIACLFFAVGRRVPPGRRVPWWAIGSGFLLLSLDETASLHELAGEIASGHFTIDWLPGAYLWVVVLAPVAAVAALWMLRFLGREFGWRSTAGRLVELAVAFSLAVPILEGLAPSAGEPDWLIVAEETAEGFAEAFMAGAMVSYLARLRIVVRTESLPG